MRIYVMTYELIDHFYIVLFNPAGGAGVGTLWGGGESWGLTPMESYTAGPISVKLSGIDQGNSVHVLGSKKEGLYDSGVMTHDSTLFTETIKRNQGQESQMTQIIYDI